MQSLWPESRSFVALLVGLTVLAGEEHLLAGGASMAFTVFAVLLVAIVAVSVRVARHAEALLDRYSVRRGSSDLPTSSLSGGNQQRVAIARELDGDPALLVACQPTRGVDIRGIAFIHQCLLDYRDKGGAVLLVSEELDEIITLADRIIVIYNGELRGELRRGDGDIEQIGRMMLGEAA